MKVNRKSMLCAAVAACMLNVCLSCAVASQAPSVSIHYTLAKSSDVSINIYDAAGHVVRELLHGAKRPAGENTATWDVLDENGKPVAAGTYAWKLLATQGLHCQYLMTIGSSTVSPYSLWTGNHGGTMSVGADAQGMYVGAGCGEATPSLLKLGLDGKLLWSIPNWLEAWKGFLSIAPDGDVVYLFSGDKIFKYDSTTGKFLASWNGPQNEDNGRIAAAGDQLVILLPKAKALDWLDPQTGAVIDSAPMPTDDSRDVKIDGGGRVLVIVDGAVESLTRSDKTLKPTIDKSAFNSPVRLAIDATSGDILVAENSHPVFDNSLPNYDTPPAVGNQVKRFSADGKFIKAYGRPGGRVWQGKYDPDGFVGIYDIASDNHGGFIVTEPAVAPRRIADYDAAGNIAHEWYGGQMYADYAYADPDDPTIVWTDSQWGELMETKLDYEAKTWKVLATYQFGGLADGMIGGTYHGGGRWRVRHLDGETYLARAGSNTEVVRVDEPNHSLVPVLACMSNISHDWGWSNKPPGRDPLMESLRTDPANQKSVLWFDFNGDGKPEAGEFRFYPDDTGNFGPDILADKFADDANGAADKAKLLKFYDWCMSGAPYYDDAAMAGIRQPAPKFSGADNRADGTSAVDADGNYFTAYNTGGDKIFGQGWWGAHVGGNKVFKWDKSGKFDWVVGEHAAGITAQPGESKYFWGVPGTTHGCIVVEEAEGPAGAHVWDQDGLWVGNMLDNPDLTVAPPAAYQLCFENFGDSIYTNPKTGNVLFFGGTQNSNNIYRVTGWDDFVRDSGPVAVSTSEAAAATEQTQAAAQSPDVARIVFTKDDIKMNGDMSQFKDAKPIKILDGKNVLATVSLMWNQHGLYAAYQVNTDTPWKSSASSPSLAFEGGAAADVEFGPLDPNRTAPIAGDQRVVAAPAGKGNMLVEFLPQLAAGMSAADLRPATYETGQGKVTFAYVAAQNSTWVGEQAATNATADPDAALAPVTSGYVVMMHIPVREPVLLYPGAQLRFDASVTLATPVGTHSAARVPWHSTDPIDKMTQDTYLESVLRPANWGIAVLE